ncbi:MAG: ABC transporter ATP-binding protein [Nitrospinae bacterium]|nr:ABC transporter ATP-binding protein [Nitrospinota bacterium]
MRIYSRLFQYLRPHLSKIIFAIFLSLIVGAISSSPVPLIQKTFDDIFIQKNEFMLSLIPFVVIGLYSIKGVLSYIQSCIIYRTVWSLIHEIRNILFEHIQRLPYSFFEDNSTGNLMSRITYDVNIMQSSISNLAKELIENSIMLACILAWIFYYKWDWALISLLVFPVSGYAVSAIGKKMKILGHRGQEQMGKITSILHESFSGIKVVRAFNMDRVEVKKFEKESLDYLNVMVKNVKYQELSSPFMETLGMIGVGVILYYGGRQVFDNQISPGTFWAFVGGMMLMYNPARVLGKSYTRVQTALSAAERVFHILDLKVELDPNDPSPQLAPFSSQIAYQNVTFQYPTGNRPAVQDICISIRKGEVLAIVGMSGAGKTTLADLLLRFHDVTEGGIYIDGTDVRSVNVRSLRDQMALVTQEVFLFNDTVWSNIAYGRPSATKEEILAAAAQAHVGVFVEKMALKYDTVIGDRGVKLSGGERQRIAIARALLKNAPILVLDEATSSLDSESEKMVQEALNFLMEHRTSLVIAHRLSTIKHADKIVVLDQGRIVEQGNHESLIRKDGLYRKYCQMQHWL